MDVDAERRKLMDRKLMVENVREKVNNDLNAQQLFQKGQYEDGGMFAIGGLFGGAIGGKLSDQSKKINEVRRNVDEELQKGVTMSTNLRRKLARMDGHTDYSKFEPKEPKNVTPFRSSTEFNLFDVDNVSLGGGNPLAGKNPATKLIDLKVL